MNHGEKLAYLAGIIDGEGSIMIYFNHTTNRFTLMIKVSNTSKELVDWLYENFQGAKYSINPPSKLVHKQWKQQYVWEVRSFETLPFLIELYPFLVIKRKQCEIAMEFRKTFGHKKCPLPKEIWDVRHELYKQMRHLNFRGLTVPPSCPSALSSEEFEVN